MDIDTSLPSYYIWYFAYGSNMSRSKLTGRRGIIPIAQVRAKIPGWTLTMEVTGLIYSEPAMSSIAPICDNDDQATHNPGHALGSHPVVHGVAYMLTRKQYTAVIASEGGGIAYDDVALRAIVIGSGNDGRVAALMVRTMINVPSMSRRDPMPLPSAKYKGLLTAGAREAGLPEEYMRYLESWPVYHFPQAPGGGNCPCDRSHIRHLRGCPQRHHRYRSVRTGIYNGSDDLEKGRFDETTYQGPGLSSEDERDKWLIEDFEKNRSCRLKTAHDSTYTQIRMMRAWLGALTFLAVFTPVLAGMERLCKRTLRPGDGQCPDWVKKFVRWVVWAIWRCHDVGFAPLFGPGDATTRPMSRNIRNGRVGAGTEKGVDVAFSPWWNS